MSDLVMRDLRVEFGATVALDSVDLAVAAGEVVAILGPSGCGKSTLLRVIAGLTPLATGTITIGGVEVTRTATHRRGVGLMFADHALFPHLDVAGNVEFGLRMAKWNRASRSRQVERMLELVGLPDRADSPVQELSNGQAQRVALARTLAPEPRVVLLDEPMSALDRILRRELNETVATALAQTDATALLVTHDRDEAFSLGHRVGVMRQGRLAAVGTPAQLREHADSWVRDFVADHP